MNWIANLSCIIVLTSYCLANTIEQTCFKKFPMDETMRVLKKILEKYSIESIYSDEDGATWMNKLIPNNQTINIDGIQYYLNDNSLDPRHRFHFNYDELVIFPILLVEPEEITNWRADHPDMTKVLSSISRDCGRLDTCGVVCCSPHTVQVQREFFDQARLLNIPLGQRVEAFGRVYSFDKDLIDDGNGTMCEYELTYYDRLYQQAERIFYRCPVLASCCGLTCKMPFDDATINNRNIGVAMAAIYEGDYESRGELNADDVKILFLVGTIIMFVVFTVITIYSKRRMNQQQLDLEKVCRKRRQTRTSEGFIEFHSKSSDRNTSLDTKISLLEANYEGCKS